MKKSDKKNIEDILALTPMQEGMLFHYLKDPLSDHYFEQLSLEISGEINGRHFENAWNVVVETNEMLRTVFHWEKVEKPVQIVLKKHKLQPVYYDFSGKYTGEKVEEVRLKDRGESFDLRRVPFRVILCKVGKDKYEMIISSHHILYDGWSNGIILKEFFSAYDALSNGKEWVKPVKTGFKEFIKGCQTRDTTAHKNYWEEYLKGFDTPAVFSIKGTWPQEKKGASNYSNYGFRFPKDRLEDFVKEYKITLASLLYGSWGILLQKYNNSRDVVFGTTVSGRSGAGAGLAGIEECVGLFINTVPLRIRPGSEEGITAFLGKLNRELRGRQDFEGTSLVDIKDYSELGSEEELFDTIVVIENYPLEKSLAERTAGGLAIAGYSMYERTHYDFTLIINVIDDVEANFYYNNRLFSDGVVERLAGHFRNIVEALVSEPGGELSEIDILPAEEKKQLLLDFNAAEAAYPSDKILHQLFEEQASKAPDKIAVIGMGELTYNELNNKCDTLARLLIEKGVGPGSIAALMVDRSPGMIIGVLGILKAGAAYLPIDPGYPGERIQYILNDSNAGILLNGEDIGNRHASSLHQEPATGKRQPAASLAYIIYTSGSTGKPKGVMVEHGSVVNTLWACQTAYPLLETDTYLLKTTYTFDVSVVELFGWYPGGGRLAILEPGGEKDAGLILDTIKSCEVTHINFVPSMFNVFLDSLNPGNMGKLSNLKYIFLAGEALLPGLVEKFRGLGLDREIALENIYGPTEASIYASWYSLKEWRGGSSVPIGTPLTNVKLYILDLDGHSQPVGVTGELCIGGAGLARGYLNRAELTAEKFYNLYKTGDLARWLLDGNIEFLGRIDHQVKVRGFRIELGEIESRLLEYDGLKEAVVVAQEDRTGDKHLLAYIVPSAGKVGEEQLREYLSAKLPDYMVPSYFIHLDELPLTTSGKIDRKLLPQPSDETFAGKVQYAAPRTDAEVKLVGIWSELLGLRRETIGIDDNFFERGGHSLRATGMVGRVHKVFDIQVPLAKLFDIPTIRGLADYIARAEARRFRPIEPTGEKDYYALSPAQKRLFVLHRMESNSTAYNMTGLLLLEGPLEKETFQQAFERLVERHESLRTSFEILNEEPVQVVHDHRVIKFKIEHYDSTLYPPGSLSLISRFLRPFDLSRVPLLRVGLINLEEEKHILMIDMHHIISDGTSLEIAARDFMAIFSGSPLEPLRIQYKDYAQWQSEEISGETLKKQAAYWQEQFAGEIPLLNLPLDYPRPAEQSFEGNTLRFEIPAPEAKTLNAFALGENATLSMVLLAVFYVLLAKVSSQDTVVVGTPVAGRRHPDLQPLIGMFVNTLALLNEPQGKKTFNAFLKEVKERALQAYENQEYPFEDLVDLLEVERDASRNPLFDVMFAFQNMDSQEIELGGLKVTPYPHERTTAKFDLYLEGVETGDTLSFSLEYCTKLFKEETIRRLMDYFLRILQTVLKDPGIPLAEIRVMGEEEEQSVLTLSRGAEDPVDRDETIHLLFEEKVLSFTGQTALVFRGRELTYEELNARANQLARLLRTRGVKADTVVGLMVERSFEMIIGMLAILKAGGAYLPIDPEYPDQRKQMMLEDGGVELVLVTTGPARALPTVSGDAAFLDIQDETIYTGDDSNLPYMSKGSHLLYVIYTSGSTGIPKGVMLEHRNLTNLIRFQYRYTNIDFSSVLQFTTISFDVSFQEIFSTLIAGGRLYLIDEELRKNIPELFEFVGENRIRTLFLPTSFLKFVLNEKEYVDRLPGTVAHIVPAGEQLVVNDRFRSYLREHNVYLHNHYGPSEAHVVTTLTLGARDEIPDRPSIGRPVSNTGIYIVDPLLRLQPRGVVGELLISGVQVGRGYLGKDDLTKEKYIENPIIPGERIYRTGDLARWLPDRNIEFLGRADHQVKIRGFRIELGEIESQLLNHEVVKEAVVIDFETSSAERALCAYVVPHHRGDLEEGRSDFIRQLREYLQEKLPAYMVPASFMVLEAIPLLPNKKVNRKALPQPEVQEMERRYEPPRTEEEKTLVNIWAGLLGVDWETISIDDDFFHLGGHSLKATLMVSKLHRVLNIKIPLSQVFKTPSVRGLAGYIREAAREQYTAMEPAEEREYYPVSSAQKRLYLLQQMEDIASGYNLWGVFRLEGAIDKVRLENTFRQMIGRHDSFRTSFEMVSGEPVQKIHEDVEFAIKYKVFGGPGTFFQKGSWPPEAIIKDFIRPFDLSKVPLLRVGLIGEEEEKHILVVDMHHIIADGMSLEVFVREFMALYRGETLPPLTLQYKDFSYWQNREKQGEFMQNQGAYWRRHLGGDDGDIPVLNLPLDYPRPAIQSFEGQTVSFELGEDETRPLTGLASEQELTLYMVLLAGFYIFLSKISGQEDIVVGGPVAGRRHADLENMIGMFVNTLALRNYPGSNKTLRTFLAEIKVNTLAAFENQDYLFEDLVEEVVVQRDAGRNPLFDALLALQNLDIPKVEIPGLTLTPYPYQENRSKFDLSILAHLDEGRLLFRLEYCTKLFKADTIDRFTRYFKQVLRALPVSLDARLADIEIISGEEKEQILQDFNYTGTDYPMEKTIHQLFEEQVLKTPEKIAVIGMGVRPISLTYNELNKKTDILARVLIDKRVKPGHVVGIMGRRSLEMILGIVAILKTGGIYLPIDADYPEERKQYMLKDSHAGVLLSGVSGDIEVVDLIKIIGPIGPIGPIFEICATQLSSSNPAYIMYTSGSTGQPKGVLVTHRNVVRLVKNTNYVGFGVDTCVLQTGAPVFDATTFEIWGPLLNGGQLVLAPKEVILDAHRLGQALKAYEVNTLWLSAPLFNQLMQQNIEMFEPLRYLLVGGDVLSPEHINKVRHRFPGLRVINGYGPTENTTFSTTHFIDTDYSGSIPIGRPIANSTAYIVDKHNHLQPVGIYGELLVGGDGVALGYINSPEFTNQKFLRGPGAVFSKRAPGRRRHFVYKTGDLARWLPDGAIQFGGRIDFQVKIRGFRVELEEIENQLLNVPGINEAVVLVKENQAHEKYLCAYIVAEETVEQADLKDRLAKKLPDYMIPSYFVSLESMPLNPNGKIDRRALPEPEISAGEDYQAPTDEIEERLVEIWSEVLDIEKDRIGINADFFRLGGHSLKAAQLISKIEKELDARVPLTEIFTTPSVRGLAKFIRGAVKEAFTPIPKAPDKEYYPVSSAQKRLYVLQQMDEQGIYYNMPVLLMVEGQIDKEKLEKTFLQLSRRHESLRTSFEMMGREPVQKIHEDVSFSMEYYDSTPFISDFIRPFDLSRPPLMRVGLARVEETKYLLMVDMHHIIADGTSMGIMMREFTALYAGEELPPLRLQYKDYCQWQTNDNKKQQEYWQKQFQGDVPRLKLPFDFERPAAPTFEGSSVQFELNADTTGLLNELVQEEDVTLYMVLTAIMNIFLSKTTGQQDILMGTVAAGRDHPDLEGLIGMFVNTLVLRNYPAGAKTFREFLQEVKTGTVEAFENQDYPFEDLVEQMGSAGNTMHNPLFDVMFSVDSLELQTLEIPGLKITPYSHESLSAKFDITIMVHTGDTVIFNMEYRSKLFRKEKIERFSGYIKDIVSAVLENRDTRLEDISISLDMVKAKEIELEKTFNF